MPFPGGASPAQPSVDAPAVAHPAAGALPDCLAPLDAISAPSWSPPAHATDCHFHINGPYDRYLLSRGRIYNPPAALIPDYLRVARALGLERMVVVQPSTFGTDNTCTLDAVRALGPDRTRAVVVVDDDVSEATLAAMHAAGARGVRYNIIHGNGPSLGHLARLAERLAPLGWHIQFYGDAERLPDLEPMLAALPVPIVLDHMAGVRGELGVTSAGFRAAERLLASGQAYVKLCAYRSSAHGFPYPDVDPIGRRFVEAAPERCLWGTDWPHPSLFGATQMPDDGRLLDLLGTWAATQALRQQILVDNPARLYGFA
ncbi:amidohydrolase family protein [Xanthobacter versatilis]|uniref:amidohydrolase family protein n=1 Tax=Xanthobacter autotrophicus (strain ATCC BAA-1158 / Py2) TaxID=78245 RepID=UPI003726A0C1